MEVVYATIEEKNAKWILTINFPEGEETFVLDSREEAKAKKSNISMSRKVIISTSYI